jgi:hypothetical protein
VLIFCISANSQTKSCENENPHKLHGAYQFPNGKIVSIVPSTSEKHWRITDFQTGKSHKLFPVDELNFQSANDWDSSMPIAFRYKFNLGKDKTAESLSIQSKGKSIIAKKIKFREETVNFKSSEIQLFGKLTLPANGKTSFKTVVMVHGSDNAPSVDRDWFPHLLAANGIATFVFDKRGTGCSEGQYLQHFGVLSDDVTAAVRWLKTKSEVNKKQIGLAGFSQGGWVAPLAATKESVAFVLVGYGMATSVEQEDLLEAPLKLKAKGFNGEAITQFKDFNETLHKVARNDFKDWSELEAKIAKYKDEKWFEAVKGSETWAGSFLGMGIEQAKVVAPQMFGTFFQPFYEPVPTLETLKIPMLWLIAQDDIEAPPEPTIEVLKRLRQQGKPFQTIIFPKTDHGIREFVVRDGQRVTVQYARNYFSTMVNWMKKQ